MVVVVMVEEVEEEEVVVVMVEEVEEEEVEAPDSARVKERT